MQVGVALRDFPLLEPQTLIGDVAALLRYLCREIRFQILARSKLTEEPSCTSFVVRMGPLHRRRASTKGTAQRTFTPRELDTIS